MSKSNLRPVYRNDEDYLAAQQRSKEIFGKVNFSMYVNMLIERDLKDTPIDVRCKGDDEKRILLKEVSVWLDKKGIKDDNGFTCESIVANLMKGMK